MKRASVASPGRSGAGQQKTEVEAEFVNVKKRALERLTTEVMQLHDILPKILNSDILENFQKLDALETIVEKKGNELEQLRMDCEHYKARLEAAQTDCMRERKVAWTMGKTDLKCWKFSDVLAYLPFACESNRKKFNLPKFILISETRLLISLGRWYIDEQKTLLGLNHRRQ